MGLTKFTLAAILDSLPQNRPIYKDSGLWQIRTDDMNDVIFEQNVNESFEAFIRRYAAFVIEDQNTWEDEQIFLINLTTWNEKWN